MNSRCRKVLLCRAFTEAALLLATAVFAALVTSTASAQDILTTRAANREQMILDGARKEGKVVLYSAAIVNQAQRRWPMLS